jgi:hypothetical protein
MASDEGLVTGCSPALGNSCSLTSHSLTWVFLCLAHQLGMPPELASGGLNRWQFLPLQFHLPYSSGECPNCAPTAFLTSSPDAQQASPTNYTQTKLLSPLSGPTQPPPPQSPPPLPGHLSNLTSSPGTSPTTSVWSLDGLPTNCPTPGAISTLAQDRVLRAL